MKNNILLRNKHTGKEVYVTIGFSWTTLFFGIFPALLRGDWKWGVIMFLLGILTGGTSSLIFPFFYNKLYLKDKLRKGYIIVHIYDLNYLIEKELLDDVEIEYQRANMLTEDSK